MAFIVPTKGNRFEIRESRATSQGPRSRTLASFKELNEEAIAKAQARTAKPLSAEELRRAARKVSAPVARRPVDQAARELIAELGKGRKLDLSLRQIVLDLLDEGHGDGRQPSRRCETSGEIAEWMAATAEEKGRALVDLLLLADALPSGGRTGKPLEFPRLDSRADA